jgi:hypothetical protein
MPQKIQAVLSPQRARGPQAALELQRRTIAKRRMQTFLVVDFLQKLCDRGLRFFQIAIFGAVDFLVLEGFDEALGLGIVVRGSGAARANTDEVQRLSRRCYDS